MKARWFSLLFVVVAISVLGTVLWALGVFEPRYEGLPASVYLRNVMEQGPSFGSTNDRNRVLVVPARIGVPILTRYTEAQDGRWRGWYQRLYPKLPRIVTRRLGPPKSKDVLVVRSVIALGFYGEDAHSAVPRLLQMEAAATSPNARPLIFRTLGSIGPRASNAIPMLMTKVKNSTADASSAAMALGTIDVKGEQSGALLLSTLEILPTGVRTFYYFDPLVPLSRMAAHEPKWINEVWDATEKSQNRSLFPRGVRFVCEFGPLEEKRFATILSRTVSDDAAIRRSGAAALEFPTGRASNSIPRLRELLRDADSNVVHAARSSLWGLAQKTNVPTAWRVEALRGLSPFEEERKWPAMSVVRTLGPPALPLLDEVLPLLRDPNERVRGRAAEAIVAIGPAARAARPAVEQLLNDRWGFVREAAAEALRSFDSSPAEAK
jgi:hypothetical protein